MSRVWPWRWTRPPSAKRFTVLCISVVYRGCAIPVAWKIVKAEEKGSWKPHWMGLLTPIHQTVPPEWMVIVMSDRGLYAPWLYQHIVSLGWHPFMRINKQGNVRPLKEAKFGSRLPWLLRSAVRGVEKWTVSASRRVAYAVVCSPAVVNDVRSEQVLPSDVSTCPPI
jgi:hypothetical protein